MSKTRIHILMLEDLKMAQAVAEKCFSALNCKLDIAHTTSSAFEKIVLEEYDIIFADIQLPDINGLDFVQAIRSSEIDGKRIPIVAITSTPSDDIKQKAKQCGCDDFVAKPLNIEAAKTLLKKHLSYRVQLIDAT